MSAQRAAAEATAGPRRVREMLEGLGPTFVKVGQFLALRPDLIPAAYCEEFLLLTDQLQPLPFSALRPILAEDLGDLEDHFAFFDTRALAAGSLAQVHLARTLGGDEVAVKILRPGVAEAIRADLRKARALATVLGHVGVSGAVSPHEVARELEQWLSEELDLEGELRHVARMRELCSASDIMVVPRPFPELSTRRIVTCERLHGTPFSEILRSVRSGRSDHVAAMGHDLELLASNLLETVLIQIFRHQYFHADMHPGNLLALSGGRIGLLDMALTDSLDPIVRRATARYLTAVTDEDPEGMYRAVADVLRVSEDSDLDAFRSEFSAATRALLRDRARSSQGHGRDQTVRTYLVTLMQIARANRVAVPGSMLSLYRSLLAAETIASQLGTGADILQVGKRFFRRLQLENSLEFADATQVQRLGLQMVNLLQNGPGQLARVLEDLADERFVLRVRSSDAAERRHQHDARTRLVTLGLIAVSVAVLLVGASAAPVWGWMPLRPIIAVVLVAVYLALALQWRRLR